MASSPEIIHTTIDRGAHTVLVVDDNPATRYSTARVVRAAGFQTVEAGEGGEALRLAAAGVSAVVLDVELPDMNGFEVCRVLRSEPATAALPVVHLSAVYARSEDRVAGLNAGADAYLVHPAEPAVLIATLQALIRARMAEDSLRRSERRFRAIYSHAQSGVCLIDSEGRFADVNPAMETLLGRPREALLGRRITEFAPPEWEEFVARHTGVGADDREGWGGEFPLCNADGEPVALEWRISEHVEPGLRIGIALDISERALLEERRRAMLEREQAARAIAERHSRTKDDFIAVLSHELRTPLNSIVGWVHILRRRGGDAPELLKGLDAIERSVKTQARIISDILDVSRINSGKLRLDQEWCDPADLVTGSVASVRQSLDDRKLTLELELDATRKVWLDPARFQQIFWNLLTNAIKFSHRGGVIKVGLREADGLLRLSVQDFGQGIKPEFMAQLFDRFAQGDSPGNRRHGGLGLGLSIVKHLVELHGGQVEVTSAGVGHGTTVRVDFPMAPPDFAAGAEAGGLAEASDHVLQGVEVVVVEDDADASEMLAMILADRGARVRSARDFESAMRLLREGWPDVLVSDIGLPGRDGYELMRRVREATPPGKPRLPAVALTAFSRAEDESNALAAGFDAHLTKPLKPHELIGAVARMLNMPVSSP